MHSNPQCKIGMEQFNNKLMVEIWWKESQFVLWPDISNGFKRYAHFIVRLH